MPLDGSAFAAQASLFASYAEGGAPLALVPYGAPGGLPVPFSRVRQRLDLRAMEFGGTDSVTMTVVVRQALATASQWTWGGSRWTVRSCEPDAMGGEAWPLVAVLERHAE